MARPGASPPRGSPPTCSAAPTPRPAAAVSSGASARSSTADGSPTTAALAPCGPGREPPAPTAPRREGALPDAAAARGCRTGRAPRTLETTPEQEVAMPAPQHHPELTEEDRAYIRRHAEMRERGEDVPGYVIPADSF